MRWGMLDLSTGRHPSAKLRAVALGLSVVTVGSGFIGLVPVAPARAATAERQFPHGQGRLAAPSAFVPPTADAGDDQSVPEGNVVTLDATRSTSSNLGHADVHDLRRLRRGHVDQPDRHAAPDQLRLDDTTEAFEFIWIAASSRGTVVKIDTVTGQILGQYWSAPQNRSKDPSRTTVDHNGNVWVGNRAETNAVGGVAKGSVTQIGLVENGQCVDRNGNGVIDTSTGLSDIKPWPNTCGVDTTAASRLPSTSASLPTSARTAWRSARCRSTPTTTSGSAGAALGARRHIRSPRPGRHDRSVDQHARSCPDGRARSGPLLLRRPRRPERDPCGRPPRPTTSWSGSTRPSPMAMRPDAGDPPGRTSYGSGSIRTASCGSRTDLPTPSRRSARPAQSWARTHQRRQQRPRRRSPPTAISGLRIRAAHPCRACATTAALVLVIAVGTSLRGSPSTPPARSGPQTSNRAPHRGSTRRRTPST